MRRTIWLAILLAVGLWIWACVAIARFAARSTNNARWRVPVAALAFSLSLVLPVADEIIANRQLESLCREGAVMKLDEAKLKGRRVKVAWSPLDAKVPNVVIPTTYSRLLFLDEGTSSELGTRGSYRVKGGVLIRALGISESNSPMFASSYCAPAEGEHEAAKRVGFTIIN